MKRAIHHSLLMIGSALIFGSCASNHTLLNDTMKNEIAAGQVNKVKLYVDADGKVVKRSLYVKPSAVPSWVSGYADNVIGKGTKEYFELEWYAENPKVRVYECTRTIKGKKVEVSIDENKQPLYIEREITAASLPAAVKAAVASLQGFKATEYEEKKGAKFSEYQIEGMQGGQEITYIYDERGTLLNKQQSILSELEVTVP